MKWESIEEREGPWGGQLHRLRVPGGWIYRCREWGGDDENFGVAMVFVPKPNGEHGLVDE